MFVVPRRDEARVTRADAPSLVAIVLAGGVLAPALLLYGLARMPALDASLLLNLEAPFTIALALVFAGEHLSAREGGGGRQRPHRPAGDERSGADRAHQGAACGAGERRAGAARR